MGSSTSFIILVEKFLTDSITPAEERAFLAGLESEVNREILRRMIDSMAGDRTYTDQEDVPMREAGFEKLTAAIQAYEQQMAAAPAPPPGAAGAPSAIGAAAIGAAAPPPRPVSPAPGAAPPLRSTRIVSLSAAALLLLGTTLLLVHSRRPSVPVAQTISRPAPVAPLAPGGNKALLQLGNGSTIALDSARDGLLASQGGARIVKLDSGELSYQAGATDAQGRAQTGAPAAPGISAPALYNTISTPRGGQYQLVLPDGTRVWLNAASSLRFPTAFTGSDRTVSMTGEVYFQVAPDKARPFRVQVSDMTVDVLGTHFNVMAYGDEAAIRTTLVEGSVKVRAGDDERLLIPGQQASLSNPTAGQPHAEKLSVQTADVEQAIAWKNGFFEFENMDLGTIMRQISRWYDVDIRYETQDTAARFGGGISRKLDLPDVLRLLEVNGVHFRLDNRILTIY